MSLKTDVKSYWEEKVCGAVYGMDESGDSVDITRMGKARYQLEPYIPEFADFPSAKGKRLLEVGVGGGVDFSNWIKNGAHATGMDLTQAGVSMTRQRLDQMGITRDKYRLLVGDAENMPYEDNTFDIVYSFGVMHHSPDTLRAFREARRVLKAGGVFKAMIYHSRSWVGLMFWGRYALLAGRPWKSPRQAMFEHLESPGTKTYTVAQASDLIRQAGFENFDIRLQLAFADLLLNKPRSKKYQAGIYRLLWSCYPRWFIRLLGNGFGFQMMITARK